jgi:hypothetical protein
MLLQSASARFWSATAALTAASVERPETPPQPSCFVPSRRNPDFVGGTLFDQIRERCGAPASRVALVGLGGVGYVPCKGSWASARN